MPIESLTRTVYRAPTAGRCYMSARAAFAAEARAIIKKKYPSERPEYESGHTTYPGFHWLSDLPRAETLYRRMTRLVRAAYLNESKNCAASAAELEGTKK